MWKKVLVMGITLVATFSVVYALNNNILAANQTYLAGGDVTGRVNQAPSNLTRSSGNNSFGMQKGDKVDSSLLGWQLIAKETYTDYGCGAISTTCTNTAISNWLSFALDTYGEPYITLNSRDDFIILNIARLGYVKLSVTNTYKKMYDAGGFSETLLNSKYSSLIAPRNLSPIHLYKRRFTNNTAWTYTISSSFDAGYTTALGTVPFAIDYSVVAPELTSTAPSDSISSTAVKDFAFHKSYLIDYYYHDNSNNIYGSYISLPDGNMEAYFNADQTLASLRPAVYLDFKNTVFATSKGTTTSNANIKLPTLTNGYTNISEETAKYDKMKLRLENTELTNTTSLTSILNLDTIPITEIMTDSTIYLAADAKVGSSEDGVNTVSALIFDEDGNFLYYKPLESAKGAGNYALDLTGIPVGSYQIGIVNEMYKEGVIDPTYSSKITDVKPLEIVEQLANLTHIPKHGASVNDYYKSTDNGNVLTSNKVASLTSEYGAGSANNENGIVYKLQPSTMLAHQGDYNSFSIPTESGGNKPILDSSNGKPYVIAKPPSGSYLQPGVYQYRVQAYDANNNPVAYETSDTSKSNPYAQLNDGTIVKGIVPSQGLITEDITMVVYPHESQITYAQAKDSNNEFYKKADINKSDFSNHLGSLTFATAANMQALYNDGYSINTSSSKLMKKGSSSEQVNAFKITADTSDKSKFYIDKNTNVESGTYEFDAWLYFKNSSGDTALLVVSDQSLYVAPSIAYVNPDKTSELLSSDTYARAFDAYASSDNNENIFTLVATDKTDLSSNGDVKYCIFDEVGNTCASSNDNSVIKLQDNRNGTATVTAKTYHKDDPDVIIRAYMVDASDNLLTYKNVTIQVNRSERKMKWEGKGISSLNSNVSMKQDGSYELKLPYDSASTTEYSFSRILKNAASPANGILALRHDEGTGSISITMGGNLASGTTSDSFKLTNTCTGTNCYIDVTKAQDDIYEAQSQKLYIVSQDMAAIGNEKIAWVYNDANTWKAAANPLAITYRESGVIPVKIDSTKLPTDIHNVKIVYTLEDAINAGTIRVANKSGSTTEGEVSILQANQGSGNASIKAVITSDNYAQKTVTLPVKVDKLSQTISFNDDFTNLASSIKVNASTDYNYQANLQVDSSTAGKGTINYTVAGNPVDMLTNNSTNKTFNVTKAGSVTITATLTDNQNYTSDTKMISKTISFYADANLTWTQDSTKPEAINTINGGTTGDADVNKELGDIALDGGKSSAYTFSVDNTKHGDDSTYFEIMPNSDKKSGRLKITKKIDAPTLQAHATQVGVGDTYEWIVHVKAVGMTDSTDKAEADIKIIFTGAQPDITFVSATDKKITDMYDPTKNIDLNVKRGGTSISDPTVSIIGYTSALSLNEDGVSATIKGANTDNNDAVRTGRKLEVKANITASSGYKTGTSDLNEVIIKKATHPTIDFISKTLSSSNNVTALIQGILYGNGKFNEDVTITPDKVDASAPWVIEPYTISKGEAYDQPEMAISPKGYRGTIDFAITASGDDNYKPLPADTKTTIEFTEAGGITYRQINIPYGDKTKSVLDFIVTPNPSDDPETVTYTYSEYDNTVIQIDSEGKITPLKAGNTTFTFKRMDSADGSEMEQNIKVTIKPKDITIYVNDLHMKVGELVTVDKYSIDTTRSTAFESGDDVGTLTYSCQDNNVEVTSLTNGLQGPVPKTLPIHVTHIGGDASKKANYTITYQPGNLNITQDEAQDGWVSIIPKGSTTYQNSWYNGDVDIKINPISGSYRDISPDGNAPWGTNFTINEEGKIIQNVSFRDPDTLARATSITKELQIDKNAPRVESIKAKSSNNKLEDILNSLTFGVLFKPGTEFTVATTDKQSNNHANLVSGTTSLTYSIYRIEKDNSETELEKDKSITIKDEAVRIKISDNSGTYKVCTIATDLAGNKGSTPSCASVVIGYEDVNIPTGDNDCPDINLDFNDDGIAELNVDINDDKIPDLNIDSDFDGKADINVDSDDDGKPDLNLVKLDEWNPGICSTVEGKTYATMEDIEPVINVVIDNVTDEIKDQTPSLNIDNKGDFKPHLNISKDGITPYLNITTIHEWKPIHDYTSNNLEYDSIGKDEGEPFAEYNYDSDDDGKADINVDLNDDKTPDINIDKDYDGLPELNIDGNGDGIPDYNLDANENGLPTKNVIEITEWKPELDGKIDNYEFDTMEIKLKNELEDNGVTVEKPGGSFLPNYSIKVKNVKDEISEEIKQEIDKLVDEDTEVKGIFDIKLYDGDKEVQSDGTYKIKIPMEDEWRLLKNIKVIAQQADKTFKEVNATIEKEYIIYETDYLGTVSILGEITNEKPTPQPDPEEKPDIPIPDLKPGGSGGSTPNTSVKGNYTTGMGGAGTGDSINLRMLMIMGISSLTILSFLSYRRRKDS